MVMRNLIRKILREYTEPKVTIKVVGWRWDVDI